MASEERSGGVLHIVLSPNQCGQRSIKGERCKTIPVPASDIDGIGRREGIMSSDEGAEHHLEVVSIS